MHFKLIDICWKLIDTKDISKYSVKFLFAKTMQWKYWFRRNKRKKQKNRNNDKVWLYLIAQHF